MTVVFAVYPLLFLGLMYGAWLATWAELGRQPNPASDYPGSLAPKVLSGAARMFLVAAPVALLFAVAYTAAELHARITAARRVRFVHVAAAAAAGLPWAGAVFLLRWDPGLIWFWFID